jgi:hypothetical protein
MAGKPSWEQANRRQKLGLVWRIRKKISKIIKDYFYLPFFLLIILWSKGSFYVLSEICHLMTSSLSKHLKSLNLSGGLSQDVIGRDKNRSADDQFASADDRLRRGVTSRWFSQVSAGADARKRTGSHNYSKLLSNFFLYIL